jgi:hypothetical protein
MQAILKTMNVITKRSKQRRVGVTSLAMGVLCLIAILPFKASAKESKMMHGWGQLDYSPEGIKAFESCKNVAVAAIRIETVDLELKGTRSQRLKAKAAVLSSSPSMNADLRISQYWSGEGALEKQKCYIVLLCSDEGFGKADSVAGSIRIVQWEKIKESESKERVELESRHLESARDKDRGAKSQGLSNQELVSKVNALPNIELPSDWESEILQHKAEILKMMRDKGLDQDRVFQYWVGFNMLSPVTHEGKYYTYVVSVSKEKALRIEGDDLFLIEKGRKDFTVEQKKILLELLK